jgi:hypothetical protein
MNVYVLSSTINQIYRILQTDQIFFNCLFSILSETVSSLGFGSAIVGFDGGRRYGLIIMLMKSENDMPLKECG